MGLYILVFNNLSFRCFCLSLSQTPLLGSPSHLYFYSFLILEATFLFRASSIKTSMFHIHDRPTGRIGGFWGCLEFAELGILVSLHWLASHPEVATLWLAKHKIVPFGPQMDPYIYIYILFYYTFIWACFVFRIILHIIIISFRQPFIASQKHSDLGHPSRVLKHYPRALPPIQGL